MLYSFGAPKLPSYTCTSAGVRCEEASRAGRELSVQEDGLRSEAKAAQLSCYVRHMLHGGRALCQLQLHECMCSY